MNTVVFHQRVQERRVEHTNFSRLTNDIVVPYRSLLEKFSFGKHITFSVIQLLDKNNIMS